MEKFGNGNGLNPHTIIKLQEKAKFQPSATPYSLWNQQ